jgi:quercetin dioxygenase-like cupin family protein
MRRKWMIGALFASAIGLAAYAGNVLATPQSGLTSTILAKSVFDELKLNSHTIPASQWHLNLKTEGMSDGYVVDNKLAAGGTTGWHSHPGPSLIFVVAGSITNYESDEPGCGGVTYHAGDGFVDEGGDHVHMLHSDTGGETIAVQLVPKGSPSRRIDAPTVPDGCPAS